MVVMRKKTPEVLRVNNPIAVETRMLTARANNSAVIGSRLRYTTDSPAVYRPVAKNIACPSQTNSRVYTNPLPATKAPPADGEINV